MRKEIPIADLVPLWVVLREKGVTALVTPAGDYVGALQLGTLDVRFATEDLQESIGEALRSVIGGLDEGTTLHFLYRVDERSDLAIREYEKLCGAGPTDDLRAYVASRAAWLSAAQGSVHERVPVLLARSGRVA